MERFEEGARHANDHVDWYTYLKKNCVNKKMFQKMNQHFFIFVFFLRHELYPDTLPPGQKIDPQIYYDRKIDMDHSSLMRGA